jgi:ABC-type Fe3+/spermidine/putrescine transport system ATPase subunit
VRLELRGVRVFRGGRAVLDGVDLALAPGELRLLVGSSGAGKTTLLRVVAGLDAPESGEVWLDGALASGPGEIRIAPHRRGVAMAFQDDALWPHLDVHAHLRFGQRDAREDLGAIATLLELVGLAGRESARPANLSGGERQRLGLARALAQRPRLLLLDEPLAHIDLRMRRRLARDLVAWLQEAETAVLWVTHHPDELEFVEGKASLLDGGKLEGPLASRELRRLVGGE